MHLCFQLAEELFIVALGTVLYQCFTNMSVSDYFIITVCNLYITNRQTHHVGLEFVSLFIFVSLVDIPYYLTFVFKFYNYCV